MVNGCDAVVHLGGVSTEGPFEPILSANILGVHNLYEACRKHSCGRVIFASSNHAIGFYKNTETLTPGTTPKPDSMYGVSKAFGENISSFYHDRYGIETACLRIGSCFGPERMDRRMLSTWLSHGDLYRLISCCLYVPNLGHTILYGCSNNSAKWWDNGDAAARIGFVPLDSADDYREQVLARTSEPDPSDPAVIYQGGQFVTRGPF
jgi:uronate dehydrogenase